MIIRVLKESKAGNMTKHGDYDTMEEAEKTRASLRKRNKKRDVEIVTIPENIGVGYEIFNTDGSLYGVIVRETNSFYYVEPAGKLIEDELDRVFFLKEDFLTKFENDTFKTVDGDPVKIKKYEQTIEDGLDIDILITDEESEDD